MDGTPVRSWLDTTGVPTLTHTHSPESCLIACHSDAAIFCVRIFLISEPSQYKTCSYKGKKVLRQSFRSREERRVTGVHRNNLFARNVGIQFLLKSGNQNSVLQALYIDSRHTSIFGFTDANRFHKRTCRLRHEHGLRERNILFGSIPVENIHDPFILI